MRITKVFLLQNCKKENDKIYKKMLYNVKIHSSNNMNFKKMLAKDKKI